METDLTLRNVTRIKFRETGDRWWTIRARSDLFTVVTQQVPFEKRGVLRYSVLDHRRNHRGPCNLIGQGWGDGTYSDSECASLLAAFEAGEVEVSHRNNVPIAIVEREYEAPR